MTDKMSILYVDDEESNLNTFRNMFRREYKVFTAINAFEGLELLNSENIDLILTDQRMPEMNGVDFLKKTLDKHPNLNRILVTGYTDFGALTEAINEARIFQFIQKPWDESQLRDVVEKGLQTYKLKRENEELRIQLQRKNIELEQANKDLLEFDSLKADFLSIISHEIRTPLNGLKGPIQIIKEELNDSKTDGVLQLFETLEISVERLEQFVLSALHITSFKAKNYDLILQRFNIYEQFQSVLALFEELLKKKNVKVDLQVDKDLEITADKDLFFISIKEILDNAIKYTHKETTISVKSVKGEEFTELIFKDEGDGFTDRVLKHLFEPFIAGERFVGSNVGLDLALVKLIVDAHKGQIKVFNGADKGAVVELKFSNEFKK